MRVHVISVPHHTDILQVAWQPGLEEFHDWVASPLRVHHEAEEVHIHPLGLSRRILQGDYNIEHGLPIHRTDLPRVILQIHPL
jgi:hypothetical protein